MEPTPIIMEKLEFQDMANGLRCLLITEQVSWERFPSFGEMVVKKLKASVVSKSTMVDMHLWKVRIQGFTFLLVFDDFPLGVTLEPETKGASELLDSLRSQLLPS